MALSPSDIAEGGYEVVVVVAVLAAVVGAPVVGAPVVGAAVVGAAVVGAPVVGAPVVGALVGVGLPGNPFAFVGAVVVVVEPSGLLVEG